MGIERMEDWRKLLEQHMANLGRDDIGIGDIIETDADHLQIEFIKGAMRRNATIAVEDLRDHDRARGALNAALLRISKAIEQQHIQAAKD
ncbi:MAG: hypothetical protein ACRDF6_01340 [bacterium]